MTNLNVANTILDQLGGRRFIVMTGSKSFAGDDNSLTFRIGRNSGNWNAVKITLTPADDYTVSFYKFRKSSIIKVKD